MNAPTAAPDPDLPSGGGPVWPPSASAGAPPHPLSARSSKARLPQEIALRILRLVQGRHLRPGDRLSAEREPAQAMGVSRPVPREALQALSLMRVVDEGAPAGVAR
jgi:DNA-binding GntR family transcriptional regulator